MKKLFFLLVVLSFFFFLVTPKAQAETSNFSVTSDITYTVSDDGNTHVSFHNTLTNTTSDFFSTSYAVSVGFTTIKNIAAGDTGGPIAAKLKKTADGYTITLPFNKQVVGIGNSSSFTLSFDTPDVTQKEGNIWELNIPGIADANTYANFFVHVTVPPSFGSPAYIKPAVTPEKSYGQTLTFSKDQLKNTPISIGYGEKQSYAFTLHYHIQNTNLFPVKTEVALPPTTNYQDVAISSIKPAPSNVLPDTDGNWLAQYRLLPSQKQDIVVTGKVQLYLKPKEQPETQASLAKYLKSQSYWEVNNQQIEKIAQGLKTPKEIYQYVVATLQYNYTISSNKQRYGAVNALANPTQAVCLEFADLFVTLARAVGIPAREIDGFAYTQNTKQRPLSLAEDILHAWPEYYDATQQTWIMVDPTWGNTTKGVDYFHTLDFDHFAFVIKGIDSEYPVPAGEYKIDGAPTVKDIAIDIMQNYTSLPLKFSLYPNFPTQIVSGIPLMGTITVTNTGEGLIPKQTLFLSADSLIPTQSQLTIPSIPPFGSTDIPTSFSNPSFLTNKMETITIQVAGQKVTQNITITPFFLTWWALIGGILIAILIIIISIITRKARRVSVPE